LNYSRIFFWVRILANLRALAKMHGFRSDEILANPIEMEATFSVLCFALQ